MKFDGATKRAIEQACVKHRLRFDLVSTIVAIESDWNPWHVRFDIREKPLHRVDHFANLNKLDPRTEMVMQSTRWGLLGVPGFLARRYGYKDPLQTLNGIERNADIGCQILADFLKKMDLEVYGISAWFFGDVYTTKDLKNKELVKKVISKLKLIRPDHGSLDSTPTEL